MHLPPPSPTCNLLTDFCNIFNRNKLAGMTNPTMAENVAVPTKETVMLAFQQHPSGCSEKEKEAVSFFYKVALMTLEGPVLKSSGDDAEIWDLLGKRWPTSMAYALLLISRVSNVKTIVHNYKLRQNLGSGKFTRNQLFGKQEEGVFAEEYYDYCRYFGKLRCSENQAEMRERFAAWDVSAGFNLHSVSQKRTGFGVTTTSDVAKRLRKGTAVEEVIDLSGVVW